MLARLLSELSMNTESYLMYDRLPMVKTAIGKTCSGLTLNKSINFCFLPPFLPILCALLFLSLLTPTVGLRESVDSHVSPTNTHSITICLFFYIYIYIYTSSARMFIMSSGSHSIPRSFRLAQALQSVGVASTRTWSLTGHYHCQLCLTGHFDIGLGNKKNISAVKTSCSCKFCFKAI